MRTRYRAFTLIELLIVIALLGALSTLVLPAFSGKKEELVDDTLVLKEMMDIRRAYAAFAADCCPTNDDRALIGQYGLEILMTYDANKAPESGEPEWSFDNGFNPAKAKGWRGPYLSREGDEEVAVALDSNGHSQGQPAGDTQIPVVYDPHHEMDKDSSDGYGQHYYRVLYNANNHKLALVYVRSNDGDDDSDLLDTSANNNATTDSSFADSFEENGDDILKPLEIE